MCSFEASCDECLAHATRDGVKVSSRAKVEIQPMTESAFSIDFLIRMPRTELAIEIDGPVHYICHLVKPGAIDGKTDNVIWNDDGRSALKAFILQKEVELANTSRTARRNVKKEFRRFGFWQFRPTSTNANLRSVQNFLSQSDMGIEWCWPDQFAMAKWKASVACKGFFDALDES